MQSLPSSRTKSLSHSGVALLLAVCWWMVGCAHQEVATGGKSVLWRVKSPTNTVYLMGSIHVLPKSAYPLKPALVHAFDDSQRLVFEIPLDDSKAKQNTEEAYQSGLYPEGDNLANHLTPATLDMLKSALPEFHVTYDKVAQVRPWLLADVLMNQYLAKIGYYGELGLDMYLYRSAKQTGRPVTGLEKIRDQTGIFTEMNDTQADAYLRDTLVSMPSTAEWFRSTVRAWSTGDTAAIDSLINRTRQGGDEKFFNSVFENRNNAWMPKIQAMIGAKDNYLVVVGSGHLVGKTGVVEMLRRRGYIVEQL